MNARVGEAGSRFTTDLDAARAIELTLDEYVDQLEQSLVQGWGGFTGTLSRLEPRAPDDVPEDYVMQPFDIKLAYRNRHWRTVRFELGRDEVGSTTTRGARLAENTVKMFEYLALPEPKELPLLVAEHQAAQKLHACAYVSKKTGGNARAHDLVDLQILDQAEDIDMAVLDDVGRRLLASRGEQEWPPTVVAFADWETLYAGAAEGLSVLSDVEAAIAWANDFVRTAVEAGQSC